MFLPGLQQTVVHQECQGDESCEGLSQGEKSVHECDIPEPVFQRTG